VFLFFSFLSYWEYLSLLQTKSFAPHCKTTRKREQMYGMTFQNFSSHEFMTQFPLVAQSLTGPRLGPALGGSADSMEPAPRLAMKKSIQVTAVDAPLPVVPNSKTLSH